MWMQHKKLLKWYDNKQKTQSLLKKLQIYSYLFKLNNLHM